MVDGNVRRGDVYLVDLGAARGREMKKARPCLIVSPDDMNAHSRSFFVAPLTTGSYAYPYRVPCRFQGKSGHVVLDQMRSVDRSRLIRRLGGLSRAKTSQALSVLRDMFEP